MKILENYSLKELNTLGIDARAAKFCKIQNLSDLRSLANTPEWDGTKMFLGGGSNVLFVSDYHGLLIQNQLKGLKIIAQDDDHVLIEAMSGENWHKFVSYCVENNFGGIENLALIPGTVGAAPLQNIGAYGVELKDVLHHVTAIEIASGKEKNFSNEACAFGYRDSIFKNDLKNKYFITAVTLRLTKRNHQLATEYGAIREILKTINGSLPGIGDIFRAVISIRQSKLPDPAVIGNAGSFFKNPVVDSIDYEGLRAEFPSIPGYKVDKISTKIPAAWMIEYCGWKGKKVGNVGVHDKQALVLINHGEGEGKDIWNLAQDIQTSVADTLASNWSPK